MVECGPLLTGLGDAAATSTPVGDGVYSISIVPPAPGSYALELGWAGAYARPLISPT